MCRACIVSFSSMGLEVSIAHLEHCHVMDYEKQIGPILLLHCQYSLRAGKARDVSFDLPSLERHLLKRLFLGKPVIKLDNPQVLHIRVSCMAQGNYLVFLRLQFVYRKDVYTDGTFERVRKAIPQVGRGL